MKWNTTRDAVLIVGGLGLIVFEAIGHPESPNASVIGAGLSIITAVLMIRSNGKSHD